MAVLTWQQRQQCLGPLLDMMGGRLEKELARAVIDASDDWAEANASGFNLAIPQPARSIMSADEKAALLQIVVERRKRR